jgi:hypothetical protein
MINDSFDRCVAVANMPPGVARRSAVHELEAELDDARKKGDADSVINQFRSFSSLPPDERSPVFASVMISLMTPSISGSLASQDRATTSLEMTRIAAALAIYRAERGQFPASLEDLVPAVLPTLPVDAFNAEPFVYRREGSGYFLYSLGANGLDDSGIGAAVLGHELFEGMSEQAQSAHREKTRAGADDVSLRLPRPAFDWNDLLPPKTE